jgi:septum formation protein
MTDGRQVARYTPAFMTIVLASTSLYRRELLQRLRLPFEVVVPDVDEARLAGEPPHAMALRLAEAKAADVARRRPDAVVIGSDQVAELDGEPIGKPHSHEAALSQLARMQGRTLVFHTAIAVASAGTVQVDSVPTTVTFRRLPTAALDAYLRSDRPYDCAGAAKIESLGIALMERVESDDPTALVGLPLIRLTSMLAAAGIDVLVGASAP